MKTTDMSEAGQERLQHLAKAKAILRRQNAQFIRKHSGTGMNIRRNGSINAGPMETTSVWLNPGDCSSKVAAMDLIEREVQYVHDCEERVEREKFLSIIAGDVQEQ